jgi:hypothetical protein
MGVSLFRSFFIKKRNQQFKSNEDGTVTKKPIKKYETSNGKLKPEYQSELKDYNLLFIDFTGVIWSAIKLLKDADEENIYTAILEKITEIVAKINEYRGAKPSDLNVKLFFDGIPTTAKIKEQIQRRLFRINEKCKYIGKKYKKS